MTPTAQDGSARAARKGLRKREWADMMVWLGGSRVGVQIGAAVPISLLHDAALTCCRTEPRCTSPCVFVMPAAECNIRWHLLET
jgi:hypothetical protein